jgi:hypothetical protein
MQIYSQGLYLQCDTQGIGVGAARFVSGTCEQVGHRPVGKRRELVRDESSHPLQRPLPVTRDSKRDRMARQTRRYKNAKTGRYRATLGAGALAEAGHGSGFGVVDLENGEQLGDLQDFLELAAEVA